MERAAFSSLFLRHRPHKGFLWEGSPPQLPGPGEAVLKSQSPLGSLVGVPPQGALCPSGPVSSIMGEAGGLDPGSPSLGRGAAPQEATPPSPCALLQTSRLEEWLSDVVRAVYVPKLNGTVAFAVFLDRWGV